MRLNLPLNRQLREIPLIGFANYNVRSCNTARCGGAEGWQGVEMGEVKGGRSFYGGVELNAMNMCQQSRTFCPVRNALNKC